MSEYVENNNVSTHEVNDDPMVDAVPTRRQFSSIPVSQAQYTNDNRGTSMAGIRAIAKYAREGRLKKIFPSLVK